METFRLDYQLDGVGWATATIASEGQSVVVTVSYLHDTLRQLTEAALHLGQGTRSAVVVFMDEPGEHQLCLSRSHDVLEFELRWFKDWENWGRHRPDEFEVRLRGTVSLQRFRHQVLNVLWKLNQEYGPMGYKEKWHQHEFPTDLYYELERQTE